MITPTSPAPAPLRATSRFMLAHPAHLIALGFGAGLSPKAPGTIGTLWGWLVFLLLAPWLNAFQWGLLLLGALALGWWACSVTARHLGAADPGQIVWDEVIAIWLVLWLLMPASLLDQAIAFGLFRFFDAVKPGPVGWADRLFHDGALAGAEPSWCRAGLGVLFDDLVAAGCTLLTIALWRAF